MPHARTSGRFAPGYNPPDPYTVLRGLGCWHRCENQNSNSPGSPSRYRPGTRLAPPPVFCPPLPHSTDRTFDCKKGLKRSDLLTSDSQLSLLRIPASAPALLGTPSAE